VHAAPVLLIANGDRVRACAQCDRLTNRVHAQARAALEDELAIHQHVDAVVRPGVHINGLRLRQEPETAPLHTDEAPRQRRILIQEREADLSGAILRQGLTGKTTGGVEGANETHGWRDQPVQNPAEDCERRHDTQIPADEPSPGDVSPGGRGGRGERPGRGAGGSLGEGVRGPTVIRIMPHNENYTAR
jgi:hypothetical protein